jgi:hypothetical protein
MPELAASKKTDARKRAVVKAKKAPIKTAVKDVAAKDFAPARTPKAPVKNRAKHLAPITAAPESASAPGIVAQ